MIQLQGFASERVASIYYDISNTAGVHTNQTGYVTGLLYDTNLLTFTKSGFQCYDVPLANGMNTLTVHATDMLGNATTTNVSVILDYSSDTTAPVLSVSWPPDGTCICASNFTFEGQVDDPTATITATITDGNGNTNTMSGLVERDGTVWINNLPLLTGTNTLTITARDAAGNVSTTSLTVYQSSVLITVNPLASSQLNQSAVTVYGTVSDVTARVYVNGIQATVNDDGTWEADAVPVSATGTAVFNVAVYPASDPLPVQPPGDSASSSVVVSSLGTAQAKTMVSANDLPTDQPALGFVLATAPQDPVVQVVSYHEVASGCGIQYLDNWYGMVRYAINDWSLDEHWKEGVGGYYDYTSTVTQWFYYYWLAPWNDNETVDLPPEMPPYIFMEYKATANAKIDAQTALKTGGTAATDQMNLYLVRLRLYEYGYNAANHTYGTTYINPAQVMVPGQTLTASGVDTNAGDMLVSAPNGATVAMTPQTSASKDYYFDYQVAQLDLQLAVDASRDGHITFDSADQTTTAKPYRFWINDSQEGGDISSAADDIPGTDVLHLKATLPQVRGASDLVNFFPVALCLSNVLQLLPPTNGWEYHLSQADGAVNFVYTDLTRSNAFDYLTNSDNAVYGPLCLQPASYAGAEYVSASGEQLSLDFLNRIQADGNKGVILVEGIKATQKPLMLEIWHNGQKLAGVPLYLNIQGVEQMYRHLNLRDGADAPANLPGPAYSSDTGVASSMGEPANAPDSLSNNKWLIFVHGYNVSAQDSRGWEAEMFKRFYWSGSHARYLGVDWLGNPQGANIVSDNPVYNLPDYYLAAMNAFATAPIFAARINALTGFKTIVAHSLGCGVTAIALNDFSLQVDHACLMDAALATECFDGDSAEDLADMTYSPWTLDNDHSTPNYPRSLWASDWYKQFQGGSDVRQTLTWKNRFVSAIPVIQSFYSSTEDVLGTYPGTPNSTMWASISGGFGPYAWVLQEKSKGNLASLFGLTVQGSDYGGWGFNPCDGYLPSYPVWYKLTGGGLREMKTPSDIGTVTQDLLNGSQFNPLFKNGWGTFNGNNPSAIYVNVDTSQFTGPNWILGLYQPNQGSVVAANPAKKAQLLVQAIPALSLPVGANPCQNSALSGKQFNMPAQFVDSTHWPRDQQSGTGIPLWLHSDIDNVAYPYLYKLFKQIVLISQQ
jgi:hypothetical protein